MTSSYSSGARTASKVIRRYRFVATNDAAEPPMSIELTFSDPALPAAVPETEAAVARAHLEADAIITAAQDQAEAIRRSARDAGYQEGLETGRSEGMAQIEAQMTEEVVRFRLLTENLISERNRLLQAAEGELVELALAIARKVLGDTAANHPEVILQMGQQALEAMGDPASYRIHVHPSDAERLAPLIGVQNARQDWELVPDERVAPGGCTVSSGACLVDARPETQLDLIQRTFEML